MPRLMLSIFRFENIFNRVSNSLDPDQVQHFVGHDLDPNCLQKVLADDTSKQIVNGQHFNGVMPIT